MIHDENKYCFVFNFWVSFLKKLYLQNEETELLYGNFERNTEYRKLQINLPTHQLSTDLI